MPGNKLNFIIIKPKEAFSIIIPIKLIADQDAWANIPPMPQRHFKPAFSKYLYKMRNLVERFFNKLKHFHAVATRYDKDPENYLAGIKLASIRIWLRFNESAT